MPLASVRSSLAAAPKAPETPTPRPAAGGSPVLQRLLAASVMAGRRPRAVLRLACKARSPAFS
eukprot:4834988-Pyramimonas_sp.AAC.1